MYKVYYNAASGKISGYVYRSNLSTRHTTVYRYIHKTSYLYTSSSADKVRKWTIKINNTVSTASNLYSKMYYVNYRGMRGYVYASNLSTAKTPIVKYVKTYSKEYRNYSRTSRYSGLIPVNTKLTTTSPQSNRLYWVYYKGRGCYVYAANLSDTKTVITKYTKMASRLYNGYIHTAADRARTSYSLTVPKGVQLQTTSPQYNRMFWVSYGGHSGYVYAANLSNKEVNFENPAIAIREVRNGNGYVYDSPDGQTIKDAVGNSEKLGLFAGMRLKVDRAAMEGGQPWSRLRKPVGTYIGWVKDSDLDSSPLANGYSYFDFKSNATITHSGKSIFSITPDAVSTGSTPVTAQFLKYTDGYVSHQVTISKVETVEGNTLYYADNIGWIDGSALDVDGVRPIGFKTPSNLSGVIYDPNGNSLGSLGYFKNRMLEVIDQKNGRDLLKYNNWYEQAGRDSFTGWVNDADLKDLADGTGYFNASRQAGSYGNQQGLAYDPDNNSYYIGYDLGGGIGKIVRYDHEFNKDTVKFSDPLKLGHATAISYYGGKLYEVDSEGTKATINVIDPDSLKVTETINPVDKSGQNVGYMSMLAIKDDGNGDPEFILLSEAESNKDVFIYLDSNGKEKYRTWMTKMGVVQGMQYDRGNLYFLANNYITVIDEHTLENSSDNQAVIRKAYHFSIPSGSSPAEAEGLTINGDKTVIGFGNHEIYSGVLPLK